MKHEFESHSGTAKWVLLTALLLACRLTVPEAFAGQRYFAYEAVEDSNGVIATGASNRAMSEPNAQAEAANASIIDLPDRLGLAAADTLLTFDRRAGDVAEIVHRPTGRQLASPNREPLFVITLVDSATAGSFRAADGSVATILANTTDAPQPAKVVFASRSATVTLYDATLARRSRYTDGIFAHCPGPGGDGGGGGGGGGAPSSPALGPPGPSPCCPACGGRSEGFASKNALTSSQVSVPSLFASMPLSPKSFSSLAC